MQIEQTPWSWSKNALSAMPTCKEEEGNVDTDVTQNVFQKPLVFQMFVFILVWVFVYYNNLDWKATSIYLGSCLSLGPITSWSPLRSITAWCPCWPLKPREPWETSGALHKTGTTWMVHDGRKTRTRTIWIFPHSSVVHRLLIVLISILFLHVIWTNLLSF